MTLDELKNFIKWCKKEKIKAASFENCSFEISELAFIDNSAYSDLSEFKEDNLDSQKLMIDDEEKMEDNREEEELLYWSTRIYNGARNV